MLVLFLFFFLMHKTSVQSQITNCTESFLTTSTAEAMTGELPPLQLVAKPSYPVVVGQSVNMHCSSSNVSMYVSWTWHKLENHTTWREAGQGRDLMLTKPEDSGQYRCRALTLSQVFLGMVVSPNHTVFIISIPATVEEKLGIAAFTFSLLALIILLAGLIWLLWTKITSQSPAKGSHGAELPPKEGLQKSEDEGGVYMNYNQSYTDLDPSSMAENNEYSTLP